MPPPRQATLDEIPIIDISALRSAADEESRAARHHIAAKIGAACRGIGFFAICNTGLEELTAKTFELARHFFSDDSTAARQSCIINKQNRGYVGMHVESLNPRAPAPDGHSAFNMGEDDLSPNPLPFRGANQWPRFESQQASEAFKKHMSLYYSQLLQLAREVLRCMAVDLGLAADYFDNITDRSMAILHLLLYPACTPQWLAGEQDDADADGGTNRAPPASIAASEHCDYGLITLLATDAVPGLEVKTRQGEFVIAPCLPSAFIVNTGDLLSRMTAGLYRSTPHRVVNRSGKERYSIPFFMDPNPDSMITTVVKGETGSPPILASDYLASRLNETYAFRREVERSKESSMSKL